MSLKIVLTGAAGRMGQEICRAIALAPDLDLAAAIDPNHTAELTSTGLEIEDDLEFALDRERPQVLIDVTHFSAALPNALLALDFGVRPVIGTSGLDAEARAEIAAKCAETGLSAAIIPNFALGCVLMMKFAEMAAAWMHHVEIMELHHDGKLDAPSGTAMNLAERLSAARSKAPTPVQETIKAAGARGADVEGIRVHSIRLPGLVAHNEVIFGAEGEVLTLRHDSMDRRSFMEGVKLAARGIGSKSGLVVGLDAFLD